MNSQAKNTGKQINATRLKWELILQSKSQRGDDKSSDRAELSGSVVLLWAEFVSSSSKQKSVELSAALVE